MFFKPSPVLPDCNGKYLKCLCECMWIQKNASNTFMDIQKMIKVCIEIMCLVETNEICIKLQSDITPKRDE